MTDRPPNQDVPPSPDPPDPPPAPSFAQSTVRVSGNGKPKDDPPREPPPPRPKRKPTAVQLNGKLEDFFGGVALAVMALGDDHCANILATQAKPLAEAYARLAERNDRVKRILENLTSTGAYGEVVAVTLATALPIAAHHSPAMRDRLSAFPFVGAAAFRPDGDGPST